LPLSLTQTKSIFVIVLDLVEIDILTINNRKGIYLTYNKNIE
jgi:hypothetical protein